MKINKQGLIEATFKWLSNYTLDEAIFKILSIIPNNRRREVLDIIETNQNAYTTASVDILKYLDLPEEYVSRANAHFKTGTFKFNEDLDNLMYREKMSQVKMSDNNNEVQVNKLAEKGFSPPNMIIDKMPSWFIDDFSMAKFPKYFVDILTQDFYICPIQIEDYSYPSSSIISMEIVSAIYRLLTSGTDRKQNYIQYIIRGENNTVLSHELEPDMKLSIHESWSVHCLRNIPMSARRALVNQVLGITDEHIIQELPAEWMLYLAISKYWVDKQQKELQSSCSIYVLLFSMLWHIIDSKIGYYRTLHQFHVKYQKKIEETQHMRKRNDYRPSYPTTATIAEALNTVNLSDCLVAAPFFISHFQFNDKLRVNPKKFNITVVHILAEFQSCLRESLHLNALLGCPYMPTTIANMFNGTFLYNLYVNFNKRNDIEAYINHVLKESPSLLHLFNVLLAKVKPLYTILQYKVIHNKVRKTKFNKKVQAETEQEEPKIIVDEDPSFYDPNNPYSLLSCTTQCN
ncbi:hypothetical protein KM043_015995 [Ampulex compressa]|nr:hypothetical protein KM043_015995 [Ampulex compressa]